MGNKAVTFPCCYFTAKENAYRVVAKMKPFFPFKSLIDKGHSIDPWLKKKKKKKSDCVSKPAI